MFDQTFVDGTQRTKKSATVAVSLLLQTTALSILILIPLVYTQGLPNAQLKNLLVAPSPPRPSVHTPPPTESARPKQAFHPLNTKMLIAPVVIPKRINTMEEAPAAPDIGVVGSMSESTQGSGVPFGALSSETGTPPPTAPTTKPKPRPAPLRVGVGVAEANLIRKVQPVYPPLARSARVQGVVEFTATISKEGNIENLQLVRGHPLLVNAAKEAILQWKYRPTLLNGMPVEVITDIIVNFTLSQ